MVDARIARIEIDRAGIVRYATQIEAEQAAAIGDLIAGNHFQIIEPAGLAGPYDVRLCRREDRLVLDISSTDPATRTSTRVTLGLKPLRRLIRDYFMICESYFEAGAYARPGRLEAIDAGRKALHNEGAAALRDRLAGRIEVDLQTARRLFTLICVLHIKG